MSGIALRRNMLCPPRMELNARTMASKTYHKCFVLICLTAFKRVTERKFFIDFRPNRR